jgi:Flp pilus assembly protein TadG
MRIIRDQRGQTTILIALCLLCLCGMTGFAVDAGMMFRAKRNLQIAADAAAISGAAELNYGDAAAAAQAAAVQNGETTGVNGATVTVNTPPVYGPFATKSGYVEVIVSQVEPTYFMKALHLNSLTVSARAVSTVATTANCLVTLGSTAPGLSVTNGAALSISSCGIIDDATGSGALTASGGASITTTSVGVVGTTSISNGATVTPTPVTGITTVADPLSYFATPPPSSDYTSGCKTDPKVSTTQTIGPSTAGSYVCYDGLTISNSPTVTLNPGLYIINGVGGSGKNQFSVSGGAIVNGTSGVTFYFVNGAYFNISNGASLNLTAPTSGPYRGMLFYQDPGDTAADSFVGGSVAVMNGIFYLPKAALTLSNGNSSTFSTDLVVGSLTMTGSATLKPYAPLNAASPLSGTRLVE